MIRMQDFALNISKFSCGGISPNLPRLFGRLSGHQPKNRNLEGKVNFLFHFPMGK
jgi:hypothetical protein